MFDKTELFCLACAIEEYFEKYKNDERQKTERARKEFITLENTYKKIRKILDKQ